MHRPSVRPERRDQVEIALHEPRQYSAPEEVANLSPTFVEIASQAAPREGYGLDQVAGVGYRKAVEFLIKDYCIDRHPNAAAEISRTSLAACINNYVGDQNVKRCAQRAT